MVKLTSNDPTWRDTLEGLFGSVLRGGSLGFSDYLSSDLKHRTEGFEARNPVTATLANIAGGAGGAFLGSSEEALAARGLGWLAKLMPSRTADTLVQGLVSEAPLLSRASTSVLPSALSGALQGGTYAYNTAADSDPAPIKKALLGATLGGVGTGVINQAARLVGPTVGSTVGSTLGVGSFGRDKALQAAGRATGLDNQGLIDRLKELPGTARVYDADPASLGDRGLLGDAIAENQELMTAARKTSADDTAGSVRRGQALEANHLEDSLPALENSLPGSFSDFIDSGEAHRSEVAKPLYDIADNASIDLAAHPDLLEHYVLGSDYAKYLVKAASDAPPSRVRDINRFLDNRAGLLIAGNDALKSYRNVPISGQELDDVYNAAINKHIARSGADLSLPRPLVRGYLDDLTVGRPPISRAYSKLESNTLDKVDRLVDDTKRAIGEVSPEDRAAQQAYRELSIPLNQADLARSLTKGGGVNRLDDEATDEYIAANAKLRAAAEAAGLKDNSKALTRYVLNKAVREKARHDAIEIPQAIVDTVRGEVRPRLNAVYGSDKVDALMQDAIEHAQLIDNRRGLVNKGMAAEDTGPKPSQLLRHGWNAFADHTYRALVNGNTDKHMAEFLQLHPEEAMAHIEAYMLKNPEGKLPDYEKYLSSVLGNLTGRTANDTVVPSTSPEPEWDPIKQQWSDRLTTSQSYSGPEWDPIKQRWIN